MYCFLCEEHGQNVDFTHKLEKNQKVRFQTEIEQKPPIIYDNFHKMQRFLCEAHPLFLDVFREKIEQKLRFYTKIENVKLRFQTKIEQKPNILQGQFPQNVTFFMRGTSSLFCCFLSNIRTKGEISDKTPYKTVTFFTRCNIFYARYMVKAQILFIN